MRATCDARDPSGDPYDNGDVQHGEHGVEEKLLGSSNHYVRLPLQRGR